MPAASAPGRRAWVEAGLLVVAANFPDLDLVLGLVGNEAYLLWHRGLTHSLLGLLVFPPALAFLANALARWLSFGRALLLCEVGFVSHLALDLPTSWGTIALYPWRHERFALDWIFILDAVLWVLPAAGILAGVRRSEGLRRRAAAVALVLSALYVAGAGAVHALAEAGMRRRIVDSIVDDTAGDGGTGGPIVSGIDVYPLPFSPFRWHGVAWEGDSLVHATLSGIPPRAGALEREPHRLGEPLVREALLTRPGQAFLWWAGTPAARVLREEAGRTVVGFADRRFYARGADFFGMEVAVDEDGSLAGATWEGDSVFTGP